MKKCKNILCDITINEKRQYCSRGCSNSDPEKKTQRTKKIEQTNLLRYGVRRPIQNRDINEKRKATAISIHGVSSPLQSKQGREKWEQTNLLRYGVTNPATLSTIQQKIEQTNLIRHGVRRPIQNATIKEKIKQTLLNSHGGEYQSLSDDMNKKRKQTNMTKYGTEFHIQKYILRAVKKLENYDWLHNQYVNLNKTATQISKEIHVSLQTVCNHLHGFEIPIDRFCKFSYKAIQWIKSVEKQENVTIQHSQHIGEYQIPTTRYSVDGYCKDTNTVYEFHGDVWHGNLNLFNEDEHCHPYLLDITAKELFDSTKTRVDHIKKLGFKVVEMWEHDWDKLQLGMKNNG